MTMTVTMPHPGDSLPPWQFRPYLEVLRSEPPRPDPLDLLWHPTMTVVTAQPFVGKTWFTLHMVRALTTGEAFLGHKVSGEPHVVRYVGTDPGARGDISVRAKTLGIPNEGLHIGEGPLATWRSTSSAAAEAQRWADVGVTCAVFDHFLDLVGLADVSSNAQVKPVLNALTAVAEAGISVLFVHHAPKPGQGGHGGKGAMGSQVITAIPRRRVSLERVGSLTKVEVTSNDRAPHKFYCVLNATECREPDEQEEKATRKAAERNMADRREDAAAIIGAATDAERRFQKALGRVAARLKISTTDEGGRDVVRNLERLKLIEKNPEGLYVLAP
jgi:RecA-family ATPase